MRNAWDTSLSRRAFLRVAGIAATGVGTVSRLFGPAWAGEPKSPASKRDNEQPDTAPSSPGTDTTSTRWTCSEVDRGDEALRSIHRDFEARVRADWTSPEQVWVRDWIWPEHLNQIDRMGKEDRFALVLSYDGSPAGLACCRWYRSGKAHLPAIDFLYLKQAFWEPSLWEEAIAHVRDRLMQDPQARPMLCFGSHALARLADDHDALQRLGFTKFEEYAYFVVNLNTALPEVAEPVGYALVPWRDEYRSRVEAMDLEMPLILGGLIESRHLHLDRCASHVALQGEEVCGAILVREPTAGSNTLLGWNTPLDAKTASSGGPDPSRWNTPLDAKTASSGGPDPSSAKTAPAGGPCPTSGSSFVDYLLVAEAHRRRGLGRALELRATAALQARGIACVGSCVGTSNTAMLALKKELDGVPLGFANLSCDWHAPEETASL